MITITVTNRKGGVAKTTTVANLAAEFSARGLRTLSVDLDPQATLTAIAGVDLETLALSEMVLAAIVPEKIPDGDGSMPAPRPAAYGGDILPARSELVEAENALGDPSVPGPTRRLGRALASYAADYDICLVDTPPSWGRLAVNALTGADYVVIPLTPDFASIKGLDVMLKSIKLVRDFEALPVEILGIFPAQARRTMHARETMNALYRKLGDYWIDIQVPQAVAVQDAQASRTALRDFDRDGKATIAYRLIADALLSRLSQRGVELIEEQRSA